MRGSFKVDGKEMRFKVAAFGELLWDLLPDATVLGGAPFNFSCRIHSLGNEATMISAIGSDVLGKKALEAMSRLQMSGRYIQIKPGSPTGTVNVFFDEFKNPDYEIIRDVAYDIITFSDDLEELIGQADCICFGTLAQRSLISRQTLSRLLRSFRGTCRFYDLNLRKGCYTAEIILSSLQNADILKLNEHEALALKRILSLKSTGLVDICRELAGLYQLQVCVVTLEERGSLAVPSGSDPVYTPGYQTAIVDPLGAGDAFSAGFVDALLRKKPLREACETGNLLGALVVGQKGATQAISPEKQEELSRHAKRNFDENYRKYTCVQDVTS
jgi:fructokinase